MKLPIYQWIGQMLAALGVVLSLAFVAYELKLSRDMARADIYQQRTAMEIDINLASLAPETLRSALQLWGNDHSSMTQSERSVVRTYLTVWLTTTENAHYQFELGLLPEEEWLNQRDIAASQARRPCFQRIWGNIQGIYRSSFVEAVDPSIAEAGAVDCLWND
ncbi:MAG: hypothetical protein ABJN62_19725 [Halioglobus sp.]